MIVSPFCNEFEINASLVTNKKTEKSKACHFCQKVFSLSFLLKVWDLL